MVEQHHERSLSKSYVETLFGQFIFQALGVSTSILTARILGPEGRGELAAVCYYPILISMLGSLSLPQAVAFAISRTQRNSADVLAGGLLVAVGIGVPQTILAILFLPLCLSGNLANLSGVVQVYSLFPLLSYCLGVFLGRDEGSFEFPRFYLFQVLQSAGNCIGIVLTWLAGIASVATLAGCSLLSAISVLIIRLFLLRKTATSLKPKTETAKELLKRGIAFHFPTVAGIIAGQADMLLAVTLLPPEQLGLYVVASAIAKGQLGFVSSLVQVSFVKIAGTADRAVAAATLVQVFKVTQVIAVAVAAMFVVATPWILEYGFGSQFLQAKPVTYWLVSAVALGGVYGIVDHGLRALGRSSVSTIGNIFFIAIQLGFGYAIVPSAGIEAIAYFKCLGHLVAILAMCLYLVRFQNVAARDLVLNGSTLRLLYHTVWRFWHFTRLRSRV